MINQLKVIPQYLIPQHLLSRLMFKLTRWPGGAVTRWLIKRFIQHYEIDMNIAASSDIRDYATFNQFFTRTLKPSARPLASEGPICPVDGQLSQVGVIEGKRMLQAKGHWFTLEELLGGAAQWANVFEGSLFCTLYLSPRDYHRIHIPVTGRLTEMIYVPGRLFSVNQATTEVVPNLFARNERVICFFETEVGPMAVILVGALFVGSLETVWAGTLTPPYGSEIKRWYYSSDTAPVLTRGEELGRFNMGSTVILLLGAQQVAWLPELTAGKTLLMGQPLAKMLR